MRYLLDNCVSFRFARMLRALEVEVDALREKFSEDVSDEELLTALRGSDCVFVTADVHIRRRLGEAKALKESKVTALFLGPFWAKLGFWDQAVWLVRRWPLLDGFARGAAIGTCAEVKANGKSLVLPV